MANATGKPSLGEPNLTSPWPVLDEFPWAGVLQRGIGNPVITAVGLGWLDGESVVWK